jgi:type II secretory pathway pseudopilin PulG
MCDPVSIGMMAISTLSAGVSYVGQQRSANTQAQSLQQNLRAQDEALQSRSVEMDQKAASEMSERARQAMVERGRMVAAFGSSGVGGGSQVGVINEGAFAANQDLVTMEANRRSGAAQAGREMAGAYRTSSQQNAAIQRPDFLTTGLQIAQGGVNAYAGYLNRQPPRTKVT